MCVGRCRPDALIGRMNHGLRGRRRTETWDRRTEDRGQNAGTADYVDYTEDRNRKTEDGGQRTEDGMVALMKRITIKSEKCRQKDAQRLARSEGNRVFVSSSFRPVCQSRAFSAARTF